MIKKVAFLALVGLAFGLYPSSGWAYSNCNGIGYFALEVPKDVTIVVDGQDNDWTWFDRDYIYTTDDMCNTLGNPMPSKDDIDVAIHIGWTPEPDNQLYGFVRVVDDTLNVDETNLENAWRDDALEFITNPDHDGDWHKDDKALRTDMGQWSMQVANPGGYPQDIYLRFQQPPEMQWAIDEGLVKGAIDVKPERGTMVPNATVSYEMGMPLWDYYAPEGAASSVRHINVAGQTLGLNITLNEADVGDRSDQLSTSTNEKAHLDTDFTAEFTLLAIGDYLRATAVESRSWGAVKALLR
jgi:hypothetical protein